MSPAAPSQPPDRSVCDTILVVWRVYRAVRNVLLLLPLTPLLACTLVLVATVAVRAGSARWSRRVAEAEGIANRSAGRSSGTSADESFEAGAVADARSVGGSLSVLPVPGSRPTKVAPPLGLALSPFSLTRLRAPCAGRLRRPDEVGPSSARPVSIDGPPGLVRSRFGLLC